MGEHDYVGDNAPDTAAPNIVEAKVWASTIVAGVLSGLVAIANALQDNPGLLAPLPKGWQSVLLMFVTLVSVFAAGWLKTSNRV